MAAEYRETQAEPDDAEGRVLNALSNDMPYAFVVAVRLEPLNLRLATNFNASTVRALLTKTLEALPED